MAATPEGRVGRPIVSSLVFVVPASAAVAEDFIGIIIYERTGECHRHVTAGAAHDHRQAVLAKPRAGDVVPGHLNAHFLEQIISNRCEFSHLVLPPSLL